MRYPIVFNLENRLISDLKVIRELFNDLLMIRRFKIKHSKAHEIKCNSV